MCAHRGKIKKKERCELHTNASCFFFCYHKRRAKVKKKTVERQLDLTHTKKMTWILNFLDVHISIVDLTNSAGKKNIYTLVSFLELFYFFCHCFYYSLVLGFSLSFFYFVGTSLLLAIHSEERYQYTYMYKVAAMMGLGCCNTEMEEEEEEEERKKIQGGKRKELVCVCYVGMSQVDTPEGSSNALHVCVRAPR